MFYTIASQLVNTCSFQAPSSLWLDLFLVFCSKGQEDSNNGIYKLNPKLDWLTGTLPYCFKGRNAVGSMPHDS